MSDTDFLDKLQSLQTPVSDQTYITVHIINIFMVLLEGKTNVHTKFTTSRRLWLLQIFKDHEDVDTNLLWKFYLNIQASYS